MPRMHLAAAELFGDRQSERNLFSIRSYGGGGKPSDGPTPIDLARAGGGPSDGLAFVYDTRWSPLRLAVIFRSSRHILVCGGSCRILTMMQIRIGSEAPKQRYPFFASALKPRGSASNRYLGSFMAGRRLIAAMRQTLIISFPCLLDLVLLDFTLPASMQSHQAPHLC